MVYSKAKLKSNGDKASPCFRPFWIGNALYNGPYHGFHLNTLHLISLASFTGVPNSMRMSNNTEWCKSHATYIKIFIDGCSSIQFSWINKHTISLWLYKSPHRSRHVVTYSRQSVSCLSTVEVQGCLFYKCNECSLSNTT
jgi:hypothetical protein